MAGKRLLAAAAPLLLLAAAGAARGGDAVIRAAGGGALAFDNGVVAFDLSGRLGWQNGVTRFALSPGTEMSDRNRPYANFMGEVWDPCDVGGVRGGPVLPPAGVYAPVARGVAPDGAAAGIRQESRGDWQLTRTVALRKGRSVADFDYVLANRSGAPAGGAFRFFSAPFPGVLPGTTVKSTSVFVPTVEGVRELDQAVHRSAYNERYGDSRFYLPAWDEGEPPRSWAKKELPTPRLNANWAAEVNRDNGYGIILFADPGTLIGFYNDPQTTLETVLRAVAPRKGESVRTRLSLGAFRLPRGQMPTAANELFLTCPGGLLPLFKGQIEIDGLRRDADPQTLVAAPAPAGFRRIRAYDADGRLIGTCDGGKVEMAPDGLEYRVGEKPAFAGEVYDPEPAAADAFLAGRNFTVYCHHANRPDVRARARDLARILGVGYAEHLPEGGLLLVGTGDEDETCRIVGGMQNSVTDQWPEPGRGAIRYFPELELTGKPALVLAGRDAAGLEKVLARWSGRALKDAAPPSSWRIAVVPTSEKIFRWSRPAPEAAGAIAFRAAKGEYESAQILVAPDVDVKDFSVAVSPFVHAESGKPLADRFDTATRKRYGHARVRFVDYFPYDPKPEVKAYPDPLFDRARASLDAGEAQGLWFTFFIPETADAGRYRATITIRGNGETKTVPVEATVREFALLRDGALWGEAYASLGTIPKKGSPLGPLQIESYVTTLVEHGMRMITLEMVDQLFRIQGDPKGGFAGLDHPSYEKSEDGRILLDCTEFDRIVELSERCGRPFTLSYTVPVEDFMYPAHRLKSVLPGRHADREGNALLNNRYLEEVLILFRKHLERKNWFERVYLRVSDEPGNANEWIEKFCQPAIHSGLKFTTAHGSGDLSGMDPGLCALWKPVYASYDPVFMAKARAAGSKTAFYTCGPPPSTSIAAPAREWRNYLWQAAKYDLDLVSWWGIQCWHSGDLDGNEAVWRHYPGHWNYLLYPEHPLRPPYYVAGKGWMDANLIESIRWEVIRDGMEDANYVYLLRKRCRQAREAGKAAEAETAERVLEGLWARHWPDRNAYRVEMAEILAAREAVAEQIERLGRILE